MTRIDFYQLNTERHRYDQVVCQLCQKAYDGNQLTLLLTRDSQQSQHLDQKLWTFRDDSFLPHDTEEMPGLVTPILIHDAPDPGGNRQLLINLSAEVPAYFAQFERVIELVTDENKQQARQHYSFYKERGYPLNHINL
ncbi:MAG: DNA polymerase III subunit chi [Gammaproteobacteria bacterium]|nr:DNA polymerase III subunit chi [Gammaproteobacteria bacterium]MDH3535201.1 DNA polymerase III subunit chi [Gammaproteobacteria bacterium]